jgi:phosphoglycolate phosphatase
MLVAPKARNHWLAVATARAVAAWTGAGAQPKGLFDGIPPTNCVRDPRMFTMMREFGAEPERTLMVGDTTHDLQLAINAGTPRLAVSYGAHDHESFSEFEPLAIAHSTRELRDWLLQNA